LICTKNGFPWGKGEVFVFPIRAEFANVPGRILDRIANSNSHFGKIVMRERLSSRETSWQDATYTEC
jgi:hypothetical protein